MEKITEFKGEYEFLSNFWPAEVSLFFTMFHSVENAYQAAKCKNTVDYKKFENISPGQAKIFGRKVKLIDGWEKSKVYLMKMLLIRKFDDPVLRNKLLNTGEAILEEGNNWGDQIWGISPPNSSIGENILGKLLMEVREELKSANKDK